MPTPPSIRALLIKPDSTAVGALTVEQDLTAVRQLIDGGYIEYVYLPRLDIGLIVDEDGRMKGLPHNPLASRLLCLGLGLGSDDTYDVVGPALVVGSPTPDGWNTNVPYSVLELLTSMGGTKAEE